MKPRVGDRVYAEFRNWSVFGTVVVHRGVIVAIHEGQPDPYEIACDYQAGHVFAHDVRIDEEKKP